jgi:hypothetical protein
LSDEQLIQEIAAWFEERGYELFWHASPSAGRVLICRGVDLSGERAYGERESPREL